jgi:hypothetical protein
MRGSALALTYSSLNILRFQAMKATMNWVIKSNTLNGLIHRQLPINFEEEKVRLHATIKIV